MSKFQRNIAILFAILLLFTSKSQALGNIIKINSLPAAQWQKTADFPDCLGRIDDSLALNSMLSFHFWHSQGKIYIKISKHLKNFDMYINSSKIETSSMHSAGIYEIDISNYTVDGTNTLQISNISASNDKKSVSVFIPYPVIIEGTLKNSGIRPETLSFISDLIKSDIENGFTSAQLAVIRNGILVYSNAWGNLNSYDKNGVRLNNIKHVDTNTLYDLASVSKMFGVNYAIQKLVTDGKLNIDTKIIDILGRNFADDTMNYKNSKTDFQNIKNWKASITVRDVLCHCAGFPPEIHYHDKNYDISTLKHNSKVINPLYTGIDGSPETRSKTLKAIFKSPLTYKPRSKIIYSDVDYMLLCFIVEKITGQNLDVYMRENFWEPMGLKRITYNPLKNGFSKDDCAATEIYGNTRDGNMTFNGIRNYTLQGEVHDYKAYHSMGGISGHAGLFSNAEDIARLASVMFNGGYGKYKFFSKNVIDMFISPQNNTSANWGIGWWREGDNQRSWYFGTQSSSFTFGHQGWTGTLVMIDISRNLVIAYLTNKINSPVVKPYTGKKIFYGNWYTSSTLGFIPQIISIGMDENNDVSEQLLSLLHDMSNDSMKLIPKGAEKNHPSVLNAKSKMKLSQNY